MFTKRGEYMKPVKYLALFSIVSISLVISACGGGGGSGGSSTGTGTVAMSVTDAKPLLPENVSNVFVTFSEVWVHKPGEGWIELDLVEEEYTIDLLQFRDGNTTDLVTPTELSAGKYTQVRMVVSKAWMTFENGGTTEDVTLEIPSGKLKTDKNFNVNVEDGAYMDIVIHFDLSMSVNVSGPPSNRRYSLKPVLHLFEDPLEAATINGSIDNGSFGASNTATIVVIADNNGEEFTRLEVEKEKGTDTTDFSIYWLVPNESYTIQIDLNPDDETIDCDEFVEEVDLPQGEGAVFDLNEGHPIEKGDGICI